MLPEVPNVVRRDLLGEAAQRGIDNSCIKTEEVLCNLAGARVCRVESGDKSCGLASWVELKMDAALGEDGTLEGSEVRADLCHGGRVFVGNEESVLKHEAGLELALDKGEKLGCARVD